jgi:hypothetical protein
MAKFDPKTGERLDPEGEAPKAPVEAPKTENDKASQDAKPKK